MKVLWVGHYREGGTGWSQAAIDYILALDVAGVDVVCRSVKLNDSQPELPERILELENKSSEGCNICIQHVLPHLMDYNGNFDKNIGLFVSETDSIEPTGWPSRLKLMDEIWVPNQEMIEVCSKSGITNVKVVPHACDVKKYYKREPLYTPVQEDTYMFYFIGEFIRRKHITALLHAYYLAFTKNDNVHLMIKTGKTGYNEQQVLEMIQGNDRVIKEKMRLYPSSDYYPKVSFVTSRITDEQIMQLHERGDCFATATFGDAWCIPAFDAMATGNSVISTDCGGMSDFLRDYKDGYLISCRKEPVLGADIIFSDLNTAHENWWSVDVLEFAKKMKWAYNHRAKNSTPKLIQNYSYECVGNLMKGLLENVN